MRNIAQVTRAVARGDLSKTITVDARGEILELKDTINTMVDQLSAFADEVTRVAKEVGTDGKLGGQAEVEGVSGTWRDLTKNVNLMAGNLTTQVRNIAQVATAVASGDLSQKIQVDARGEVLELKDTINTMVDQLSSFADEVTRVAREVGTDGKLGGQAKVPGASGTWRDLTDNVNQLAGNLTTQVRAIAEVSTAVTEGDLTRSIAVEAQGEVAELKDNLNQMIANLRDTTQTNAEQDWLKTNLARISGLMQGQRDLQAVSRLIMSEVTPVVSAQHGAFFLADATSAAELELRLIASYGYKQRKSVSNRFALGEGLVGQAALESQSILITEAPADYIKISSGLGEASPVNVVVMPVLFEGRVLGVIELAALRPFTEVNLAFLDQLVETIGVVLNTIMANMRTEELLLQSQSLAQELGSQQEELRETNREIEQARMGLQEKADQLAISSRYKSEFLANMSHELRTPLNSMLILSGLLSDNGDGNLSPRQVEFAETIHGAGSELLALIDSILDLSKVEAGRMEVNPTDVSLARLRGGLERTFRPVAETQGLAFTIEAGAGLPATVRTDEQRMGQVLKNLLSNAFKFTSEGGVTLRFDAQPGGARFADARLRGAERVLAVSVTDSGIGIARDELGLVFEAFQQADGTTTRRHGGSGLGLSISREIARLLSGEVRAESTKGQGSTFTLYLPLDLDGREPRLAEPAAPRRAAEPALAAPAAVAPARSAAAPSADRPDALVDDRGRIDPGDRVLLVVEEDPALARLALASGRRAGFKCLLAPRGDTGVALAHEYGPDAIVLDLELPGTNGLAVLDHLKHHPETRHLPVQVLADGDRRHAALRAGAAACLVKPVSAEALDAGVLDMASFLDRDTRSVLLVDADVEARAAITELIGEGDDVAVTAVGTSEAALAELGRTRFECLVLDVGPSGAAGVDLLDAMRADPALHDVPVVAYTATEVTPEEGTRLHRSSEELLVKDASSPERLLDETALYLHRAEARLPGDKRRMLERLRGSGTVFRGKRVLIVDDDVRNVFALTNAFEIRGMEVLFAENGQEALDALERHPEVDLVLMDVMMPGMDGYECMVAVRADPAHQELPIIALTAKAMRADRDRCLAAGASDHIAKPIEVDQLLSLMRVWLRG